MRPFELVEEDVISATSEEVILRKAISSREPSDELKLYTSEEMEADGALSHLILPHSHSGYRVNLTFRAASRSIVQIHNETINIWSHIIGALIFLKLFWDEFWDLHHPFVETTFLLIYLGSCTITMVLSSLYHSYNCCEKKIAQAVFKCDLSGISLLEGVSGLLVAFSAFRCDRMAVVCLCGLQLFLISAAMILINSDKFIRDEYKNCRAFFFMFFNVCCAIMLPIWYFMNSNADERGDFMGKIVACLSMYVIGFVIYITYFPECVFSKKTRFFDIYFNSHQFWHLFSFLGALLGYYLFKGWAMYHAHGAHCEA
eukprot:CAMPEP_0114978812 /NCGR_PEP_ID=MMETSP0216-20121206/4022_1 /TAXON_ID=223996 /ORGANISM="Protocruzia adherens, Strain Boccale" /LENGTH=313 /DNA_ID=CAMNT_0002340065 /DNA_START=176 /DNA_END=1117 /DNA_ORIENTATION=+